MSMLPLPPLFAMSDDVQWNFSRMSELESWCKAATEENKRLAAANYKIILDESVLDGFLATLPALEPQEVWYACLFGRHKYDKSFPNTRDAEQLARFIARDVVELKEKLRRLETPIGSYARDGMVASQDCLSVYMSANPRSLVKANKDLLIELATRFADGVIDFNPISVCTTCVHRALGRKFYIDFDFDFGFYHADGAGSSTFIRSRVSDIASILPDPSMYRILVTRGGFHLLVAIAGVRALKTNWHQCISHLPGCDVRGSNTLIPVPGCAQGGFIPHFWSN